MRYGDPTVSKHAEIRELFVEISFTVGEFYSL
jgi:hypothetical protein